VKGHQRRFGQTGDIEHVGQLHQEGVGVGREDAFDHVAELEVEGAAEHVGQDHGRKQEELRGAHEVDHVLARAAESPLHPDDARPGVREDGDDLVEQVEREMFALMATPTAPKMAMAKQK
jgi:hypothetical protein